MPTPPVSPPVAVAPPASVARSGPPAAAALSTVPAVAAPRVPALAPPRFDIVRVNPQGGTVLAGRAEPGAEVILRANGRELGRVRADAQGQWVLAGATALPAGTHEITIAMLDATGRETAGDATILAVVAERPAPSPASAGASRPPSSSSAPVAAAQPATPAPPLVLMTTPQGAPTLLQGPPRGAGVARLGLDLVDYDNDGEIRFAGTASPGATVRMYIDDAFVGDAEAGADGRWALMPRARVAQGDHRLRLDQVDRAGRVAGRVEQPFQRAVVAALEPGAQRVVVQPRQNLWRIARRAYGQGVRYTEIFAANRDVISDPARIYPGQVFTIPGAPAAGASTPSSASSSR